jgi:TonB-dependent starch-binding outer membrane protein SusC
MYSTGKYRIDNVYIASTLVVSKVFFLLTFNDYKTQTFAMRKKSWLNTKGLLTTIFLCMLTLFLSEAYAQNNTDKVTFTGTVITTTSKPIANATVSTRDGKFATKTDEDGKFSLSVSKPANRVLVISSVGYVPSEIRTGTSTFFVVRLKESNTDLDAVVVVGYGTKKKADLSGAVTEIGSEMITNQPITSVDQGLAGLLPGVTLREGSGAPGAGPEILIRGINGFGNNKPLVVIDDVIFENGNDQNNNPLALINPEDIANVVVLKDAASKAIYGSRATAGVILITTKKGSTGKPKISFSHSLTMSRVMEFENPNVLNATELAQFRKDRVVDQVRILGNASFAAYTNPNVAIPDSALLRYDPNVLPYLNPSSYGEGTNWFNEITRTAITQNSNISVSGGAVGIKYFVSANYLNQEGVVVKNDIKRYSLKGTIEAKISDKLKMGLSFNPTRTDANRPSDEPGGNQQSIYGTITSTYWIDPSVSIYQPNGFFNYTTKGNLVSSYTANPLYQLTVEQETRRSTQILANTFLEFQPIKNLTLKSSINYGYTQGLSKNFQPTNLVTEGLTPVFPNADSGRAVLFNQSQNNFINDNIVRYKFIKRKHDVNIMIGFSVHQNTVESSTFSARKILDENFILPSSNNVSLSANNNFTGTTGYSRFRFLSQIGRLNYTYNDRYFVDFSLRRDASSRFGRDVRYGSFPAGSLAWKISEENFFKVIKGKWLNDLRFEAGFGVTGNASVANYGHLGAIGAANYSFGGNVVQGNSISTLPNSTVTWETAEQLDLGLNASLLKKRVSLSFNWYRQITKGPIATTPISFISGFGSVQGNQLGSKVQNKGFEATVDVVVVKKKNFRWTTGVNVSQYKNILLDYFLPTGFPPAGLAGNGTQFVQSRIGQPIGVIYGLKMLGLYTADDIADPKVPKYASARVGSPKFLDGNGDGKVNNTTSGAIGLRVQDDYVELADPNPDLMFGFNNQIVYKNINIRTVFAGQIGGAIYDLRREVMWNVDGNFNVGREVLDRWRPGDDPSTKTFGSVVDNNNTNLYRIPSDNKVYDGSYIALKNFTIGFNFTKMVNKKKRIFENAEVNMSIRNVFYIANYKFGNPESRRAGDGSQLRSINNGGFPISRNVAFGLNLSF